MSETASAEQRVADWMIARSYATGHGDTVEDMLTELEWQAQDRALGRIVDAGCRSASRGAQRIAELAQSMKHKDVPNGR